MGNMLSNPWVQKLGAQVRYALTLLAIHFVVIATVLGGWPIPTEAASTPQAITVYRDPGCRCCGGWMEHLTAQGFEPENVEVADMDALKQESGIPADLASCHTAFIQGYWIEGHVPVADIQRLLAEQPDIAGIAVPGMPVGTPGMESGDRRDSFAVLSLDKQGHTAVFNQYQF
jgi:hypothetical protein